MSRSVSRRSSPRRPPIRATLSSSSSRSSCQRPLRSAVLASRSRRCGAPARLLARLRRPPARRPRGGGRARACRAAGRCARSSRRARAGARGSRAARRPPRARAARARACRAARSGARGRRRARARRSSALDARGAARRSAGCVRAPPGGTCGDSVAAASADHEVELAPPRDLDHAREIDLAQLDRRARERAHDGARRPAGRPAGASRRARRAPPRRLRKPPPSASSRERPGGACAISQPDAFSKERRAGQGYAGRRRRAGLRSGGGRDRLGRGPADRRADRRLAPVRRACAPRRSSRWRTTSPTRVSSLQRPARCPAELPPLELVDRPAWIAANLRTMRPLLGAADRAHGRRRRATARRPDALGLGADAGRAGGRADGHALPARARPVRPRAARRDGAAAAAAARARTSRRPRATWSVDRDELVLWVTIHEITHAVQFSGAPWLREHLGGMLKELIEGLQVSLARRPGTDAAAAMPKLPDVARAARAASSARARGEMLRLTLGEDRWRLVERMQAAMSLIEGHAEHTMDVVGAEVLPSLPRAARRDEPPPRESRAAVARARAAARARAEDAPVRGRAGASATRSSPTAARRRWRARGAARRRCRAPRSSSSPGCGSRA